MGFKKGGIPWNKGIAGEKVHIPREHIEMYLLEGMSQEHIGQKFGVSRKAIASKMKRYGLQPAGKRKGVQWNREILYRMYVDERKTMPQIAKELGIKRESIRWAMCRLGIPRRKYAKIAPKREQRKTTFGYMEIYRPEHPHAKKSGYIFEHRLIIEKQIGRYLLPYEYIHHINGIRDDNQPENLKLVSRADHQIYTQLCKNCPLRKEIRLLQWQVKDLREQLQYKLGLKEVNEMSDDVGDNGAAIPYEYSLN